MEHLWTVPKCGWVCVLSSGKQFQSGQFLIPWLAWPFSLLFKVSDCKPNGMWKIQPWTACDLAFGVYSTMMYGSDAICTAVCRYLAPIYSTVKINVFRWSWGEACKGRAWKQVTCWWSANKNWPFSCLWPEQCSAVGGLVEWHHCVVLDAVPMGLTWESVRIRMHILPEEPWLFECWCNLSLMHHCCSFPSIPVVSVRCPVRGVIVLVVPGGGSYGNMMAKS